MTKPETKVHCAWCDAKTTNRPDEFDAMEIESQTQAAACLECGQMSVWDSKLQRLRKPTTAEAESLERCHVSQRLKGILEAWRAKDADAMRAQLAQLADDRRADEGKMPLQQILDLRKHYIGRQRDLFRQTLQHVKHGDDALQIVFFALLEMLETAATIYGCQQNSTVDGADAITQLLIQLAESADALKLNERVDRMLATVRKQSKPPPN